MSDHPKSSEPLAGALAEMVVPLLRPLRLAAPFLTDWPASGPSRQLPPPSGVPVLDWTADLARNTSPTTAPIVEALVSGADQLAWRQTYSARDFGAEFLLRYGWTELIGLRGPIASETLACGFLMLGPHTTYPAHAHEAEELYVPLSGTASWQCGEEAWGAREPGTPIHHPSWMPHAMRTGVEPLLALYLWRGGDLAAKSKIMTCN